MHKETPHPSSTSVQKVPREKWYVAQISCANICCILKCGTVCLIENILQIINKYSRDSKISSEESILRCGVVFRMCWRLSLQLFIEWFSNDRVEKPESKML